MAGLMCKDASVQVNKKSQKKHLDKIRELLLIGKYDWSLRFSDSRVLKDELIKGFYWELAPWMLAISCKKKIWSGFLVMHSCE